MLNKTAATTFSLIRSFFFSAC